MERCAHALCTTATAGTLILTMLTVSKCKRDKIDLGFRVLEHWVMYGTIFESMYTGSMRGSGALMFAVWPYVLAHMRGNRDRTIFRVELNAEIIAFLIGESQGDVEGVLEKCCQPDPNSRSEVNEGRKLVKVGQYEYEVVNGEKYDRIRRESNRKAANARYQDEHRKRLRGPRRARVSTSTGPLPGEREFVSAMQNGAPQAQLDRMSEPKSKALSWSKEGV